jgi:hypothetical protein
MMPAASDPSPSAAVPDDVKAFLARYVDSVEQLEILLLLHQHPDMEWTPEATATRLYGNPESAARRLARLRDDRLLTRRSHPAASYRYDPASAELAGAVARLAETYRERRVAVITLLASRPMDNVRAFSEAFRLGRREE